MLIKNWHFLTHFEVDSYAPVMGNADVMHIYTLTTDPRLFLGAQQATQATLVI